ncbi:efflux RND transporter periplasmic adaptor subunit [Aquimarina agarivorans]|uniref:efflux RND transporter periplasmic adaptor subunit n=1 Tax=Aquimarina agarivorans TaxID=980584 RepID=UPI000248ED15|nr:efflux RND transporter periplasmic adaptor subunit [Aquimarina agarivorans]
MKKSTTVAILILIIVVFTASLVYFWKKNQKSSVVYKTKQATTETITLSTIATGSVVPDEEVSIRPNISGVIQEIYVQAGDFVKAGDKIARIKVIPSINNLQSSRNGVQSAKINLATQEKIFKRQKELFDKGVISANDFDQSQNAYEQAKQTYNASNENYQIVKTGTAKGFNNIAQTIIKATISGQILDIPVEEGVQVIQTNNFNEGTEVASIADVSKMIFKGKIDESEVGKIKEGMPIKITIGAMPDKEFDATLNYIAPKGFAVNGAVQFDIEAKVIIPKDSGIRAGLSANASIILDKATDVLAISEALLQYDKETKKPYVEIETGEQEFERKEVTLGISDGITVEIKSGVTKEDKIKEWNAITIPEEKEKRNHKL